MEMIGIIGWVLFVLAALVAAALFAGQAAPRKALADAQEKLRRTEAALEAAQKVPVAVATTTNGAPLPAPVSPGVQKKLATNDAEIKRLKDAVADAEKQVRVAAEKVVAADAKIADTGAKIASAEAMVAQTRSKAAEAGHVAVQEAKRETESLRVSLVEAEARAAAQSLGEIKISELVRAAKNAESLQAQLAQAEARTGEAVAVAERASRERFEAQLIAAKQAFAAEKQQLVAELSAARHTALPEAISIAEPAMPTRPRKQPAPASSAEIGTDAEKPLIILADSDTKSTDALSKHLTAAGYDARAVQTVAEAMELARTASPAALAFDGANLPDGDCWQMLSAMKDDPRLKEIPMLIFAPGKDRERAMEMGAAGCFAKPVDKAVLVSTIKAAMVKRKQRARLAAASGGASGAASNGTIGGTGRRSSLLTTSPS